MLTEKSESLLFLLKNGRVVKFNRFFLTLHKIVDYRQKFCSNQTIALMIQY